MRRYTILVFAGVLVFGALAVVSEVMRSFRYPIQYTRDRNLHVHDVAGVYSITGSTIAKLKQQGPKGNLFSTVTLHPDGSFAFLNIPDWWRTGNLQIENFDTGSGSWSISSYDGAQLIKLVFARPPEILDFFQKRPCPCNLHLMHRKPPYALLLEVGDPDRGDTMEYSWVHSSNK